MTLVSMSDGAHTLNFVSRPSTDEVTMEEAARRTERHARRARRGGAWWVALSACAAIALAVSLTMQSRRQPTRGAVPTAAPARLATAAAELPSPADRGTATPPIASRPTPEASPRRDRLRTSRSGFVTVSATPWGQVFIDGRRVADETPAYRLPVVAGRHSVAVFDPARRRFSPTQTVVVREGESRRLGFEW
jgi:hypothetical protein